MTAVLLGDLSVLRVEPPRSLYSVAGQSRPASPILGRSEGAPATWIEAPTYTADPSIVRRLQRAFTLKLLGPAPAFPRPRPAELVEQETARVGRGEALVLATTGRSARHRVGPGALLPALLAGQAALQHGDRPRQILYGIDQDAVLVRYDPQAEGLRCSGALLLPGFGARAFTTGLTFTLAGELQLLGRGQGARPDPGLRPHLLGVATLAVEALLGGAAHTTLLAPSPLGKVEVGLSVSIERLRTQVEDRPLQSAELAALFSRETVVALEPGLVHPALQELLRARSGLVEVSLLHALEAADLGLSGQRIRGATFPEKDRLTGVAATALDAWTTLPPVWLLPLDATRSALTPPAPREDVAPAPAAPPIATPAAALPTEFLPWGAFALSALPDLRSLQVYQDEALLPADAYTVEAEPGPWPAVLRFKAGHLPSATAVLRLSYREQRR